VAATVLLHRFLSHYNELKFNINISSEIFPVHAKYLLDLSLQVSDKNGHGQIQRGILIGICAADILSPQLRH
jgi:hypothetical protein